MKAKEKWSAVEATYKQADILGTELECFRALFRQEQLSIPRRIEVCSALLGHYEADASTQGLGRQEELSISERIEVHFALAIPLKRLV